MNYVTPKININALRIGYYTDKYFLRTQEILVKDKFQDKVHYQYFPRKDCVVCGIPQVLQILKECVGYYSDRERAWKLFNEMQQIDLYDSKSTEPDGEFFIGLKRDLNELWISKYNDIEVFAIEEGSEVKDMEPVIGIIGNPAWFAHLETPTLGVLAQQSAVATSVRRALSKLDPSKNLYFFPARFRHYMSQAADGYASVIAGGKDMSTDANGEYWGYTGLGTIPHLLIAAYGGDTALAALKFDEYIDPKVNRIILVDWDNDCIGTTVECVVAFLRRGKEEPYIPYERNAAEQYLKGSYQPPEQYLRDYMHQIQEVIGEGKGKIYGVRFDTSGSLWDRSVSKVPGTTGVSPELVIKAREKFDSLGLKDLKIMVSGGFDEEKLGLFKKMRVPYDVVGIGSSIVNKFTVDFTADAVMLNGKQCAKVGRSLQDWSRMKKDDWFSFQNK